MAKIIYSAEESEYLIKILLEGHAPVAKILHDRAIAESQAVLVVEVAPVLTPEQYQEDLKRVVSLRAQLSRALLCKDIRAYKLVFEVGQEFTIRIDDKNVPSIAAAQEFLKHRLIGD